MIYVAPRCQGPSRKKKNWGERAEVCKKERIEGGEERRSDREQQISGFLPGIDK